MSIPVKLDELGRALADHDLVYLLTVGPDGVKVLGVTASLDGTDLVVTTSSPGTARNLAGNPTVTVLCPPREVRGYSLIIDGTGRVDGDGFRVTPSGALLHRPAPVE